MTDDGREDDDCGGVHEVGSREQGDERGMRGRVIGHLRASTVMATEGSATATEGGCLPGEVIN